MAHNVSRIVTLPPIIVHLLNILFFITFVVRYFFCFLSFYYSTELCFTIGGSQPTRQWWPAGFLGTTNGHCWANRFVYFLESLSYLTGGSEWHRSEQEGAIMTEEYRFSRQKLVPKKRPKHSGIHSGLNLPSFLSLHLLCISSVYFFFFLNFKPNSCRKGHGFITPSLHRFSVGEMCGDSFSS